MRPGSLLLVGERDPEKRAHVGIEASIAAFERESGRGMPFAWIGSSQISPESAGRLLEGAAGVWAAPGGYANPDGALLAIEFARRHDIPFLGTCGGFQFGVMEFAKNVLGRSAAHQELEPHAADPLIVELAHPLIGAKTRVLASPELSGILGAAESLEEFNCRYGLRAEREGIFAGSDLRFVARDEYEQARAFILTGHRFFVGTLFQPERRVLGGELHPIARSFFQARRRCA